MTGIEWAYKNKPNYWHHNVWTCEDEFDEQEFASAAFDAGKEDTIKNIKETIAKMANDGHCAKDIFEAICGDKLISDEDGLKIKYHWEN